MSKATGRDRVSVKIIKAAANIISPSIPKLCNRCFATATFPRIWKTAEVIPLFKGGNKTNVDNYRPISILPVISKIIERYGVSEKCVEWFKSYLLDRWQFVTVSQEMCIQSGVPQDSLLGPLLFIIFITDIPCNQSIMPPSISLLMIPPCHSSPMLVPSKVICKRVPTIFLNGQTIISWF